MANGNPLTGGSGQGTGQLLPTGLFGTDASGRETVFQLTTSGQLVSSLIQPVVTVAASAGTGLTASTTYNYFVTALNQNGETAAVLEVNGTTAATTNLQLTLTWAAVPGALSYNIYRSTTPGLSNYGASSFLANTNLLTYTDTGSATTSGTPPTVTTALISRGSAFPANPYGRVYSTMTPVSTTAAATTQTLGTFKLPGGLLSTAGQSLKFRAWGSTAANTDAKTLFVQFGSTTVATTASFSTSGTLWYLEGEVFVTGAATQVATGFSQQAAIPVLTQASPTVTLANASTLTVQATQGTASVDVTMLGFVVELAA